MSIISGIYCITFLKENKKYLGSSFNIKKRWSKHKFQLIHRIHDNEYIQESFDKYGLDNMKFEIIQILDRNRKNLTDMEFYWIIYYNSFVDDGGGYNKIRGDNLKYNRSIESVLNCAEARPDIKGDKNPFFGKHHKEDYKEESSKLKQGEKVAREKTSSIFTGVYWNKRANKWRSHICYRKIIYHLGYYEKETDAAIAYNKKATELFGPNAKLNIIGP